MSPIPKRPHFSVLVSHQRTEMLVHTVDQNFQEAWAISNILNVHSTLTVSVCSPLLSNCSIFFLFSVAVTTLEHLGYLRATAEVACTIQELITWSQKKIREASILQLLKQKWVLQTMPCSPSLTNNALLSSFTPDSNIFFKRMIYKNKYLFHVCIHTMYSERLFLKSWWRKTVSVGLHFRRHKIVWVLIIFHLKFEIGFCHGAELFSHTDASYDIKDILYCTCRYLISLDDHI